MCFVILFYIFHYNHRFKELISTTWSSLALITPQFSLFPPAKLFITGRITLLPKGLSKGFVYVSFIFRAQMQKATEVVRVKRDRKSSGCNIQAFPLCPVLRTAISLMHMLCVHASHVGLSTSNVCEVISVTLCVWTRRTLSAWNEGTVVLGSKCTLEIIFEAFFRRCIRTWGYLPLYWYQPTKVRASQLRPSVRGLFTEFVSKNFSSRKQGNS